MDVSKYLTLFANLIVGVVFIFSGLVKLNDPYGFAYKIEEYLYVLSSHWTRYIRLFLPYTLALSIGIATTETVLGTAVWVYWQRWETLNALLLLTLFFTVLTLYTATSKRLASCGCFGNALALTPWQSFGKSVVLLFMIGLLYNEAMAHAMAALPYSSYWVVGALVIALGFGLRNLRFLPIKDFSPYSIGCNLASLYFPLKSSVAISTNAAPTQPNTNFAPLELWCGGQLCTRDLLSGHKLLLIVHAPSTVTPAMLRSLEALANSPANRVRLLLVTVAVQGKALATALRVPLYTAQPALLRLLSPLPVGVVYVRNGVIMGKWHHRDLATIASSIRQG